MPTALVSSYRAELAARERSLLLALVAFTRRTLDPTAVDRSWKTWSTGASLLLLAAQDQAFDTALDYFTESTLRGTGELPSVALLRPDPNLDRLLAALRLTGPITVKQAAIRGLDADAAFDRAVSRTSRFGSSVVGDRASDTLWTGMSTEPTCIGYRRVLSPSACARCRKIGTKRLFSVEPSRSSHGLPAGFFSRHPRCHCVAEPVYSSGEKPAWMTPKIVPLDAVSERAPLLT
jgi:hypothetical protein